MKLSKYQIASIVAIGFGAFTFIYSLNTQSWKSIKNTFDQNSSTISLVAIIGGLGSLSLTTAKDSITKGGEDQMRYVSQMNEVLLKEIKNSVDNLVVKVESLETSQEKLRTELKGDISELRTELKGDISELRKDVHENTKIQMNSMQLYSTL
ncbi:hypothetical protein HC766_04735 [Candidatus Gracilibacteria bacterium]|nr:hypothetical protein [Candidatus Gracilibacteria bacterium]